MNNMHVQLERLIDEHGGDHVLEATAEVFMMKADHIYCNWQDKALARIWGSAAKKIDKLAAHYRGVL